MGNEIDTLVIIPSGPLWYLPFSALITEESGMGERKYLIEEYTLAYLPSLASLPLLAKKEPPKEKSLLCLANPTLSKDQQKRLGREDYQYSVLEDACRDFSQTISGKTEEVYVRDEAKEVRTYHPPFSPWITLYAAHGMFNNQVPLQSQLFLAPGSLGTKTEARTPDGNYMAWEVALTDYRGTQLVVLAACETLLPALEEMKETEAELSGKPLKVVKLTPEQLEKLVTGDEIVGLSRTFLSSGAQAVLGTLWKASPDAVKELLVEMARSYMAQNSENRSWVRALTEAQRELIEEYSRPYYWASYQLVGWWR